MIKAFGILLLLFSLSPAVVQAQEISDTDLGETIVTGDNAFSILLTRETQDPDSKRVVYKLQVLPNISSDRVQVNWQVSGISEVLSPITKSMTITKGISFEETLTIRPRNQREAASTEVRVEITAVTAGEDYIAAANDQFISTADQEVLPLTEEYNQAKNLLNIRNYGLLTIALAVVMVIGYLAYRRFMAWLQRGKPGTSLDY